MNNQLMVTNEQVDALSRVAKALAVSGYFQDATEVAKAYVKVQAGQELGLPPVASMSGIHIVKGKPTLGANLIATLIKNDPRYNYRVLELTDDVCRIKFYEDGQECGISEFTAADAQKAGTQNMNKFPKNMLFARAISNGAKWFTPGIFGGVTVYTPEELGADVDEDGDIIDVMPQVDHVVIEPVDITDIETVVPDDNRLTGRIADLRATIEGANGSGVALSFVNQRLVDTGLYNAVPHAHNAIKKWDGWQDDGPYSAAEINGETVVKTATGLKLFDWAVNRKVSE